MKRSRLAIAGAVGAIVVSAVGGVTAIAQADPTPGNAGANAASPTHNPKADLPANINPDKNPNEKPAPGGPKDEPKPTKEQLAQAAKHFLEEHPNDGIVCYGPDGTVADTLLVYRFDKSKPMSTATKQRFCDRSAERNGTPGLHP